MSKKYEIIGFAIVLIFVIILVLTNANLSIEKIDNNDTNFVVGFDKSHIPFTYMDNGKYTGFDLEIADEIAKRNNWSIIKKPITWSEKDEQINSGDLDCVLGAFTIEGRENDYEWTEPYLKNKVVVVVKSDSNINSISDLKGKRVEYLEGSVTESRLTSTNKSLGDTFASKTPIKNYGIEINNLYSNNSDAMFGDVAMCSYYVSQSNGKLKILNESFVDEHYGIGFKLGNTDLRDKVQATLNEMIEDGTIDKIAEKYNNYDIKSYLCI